MRLVSVRPDLQSHRLFLVLSVVGDDAIFSPTIARDPAVLSCISGIGLQVAQAAIRSFVAGLAPARRRGAALVLLSTIIDIGQAAG